MRMGLRVNAVPLVARIARPPFSSALRLGRAVLPCAPREEAGRATSGTAFDPRGTRSLRIPRIPEAVNNRSSVIY